MTIAVRPGQRGGKVYTCNNFDYHRFHGKYRCKNKIFCKATVNVLENGDVVEIGEHDHSNDNGSLQKEVFNKELIQAASENPALDSSEIVKGLLRLYEDERSERSLRKIVTEYRRTILPTPASIVSWSDVVEKIPVLAPKHYSGKVTTDDDHEAIFLAKEGAFDSLTTALRIHIDFFRVSLRGNYKILHSKIIITFRLKCNMINV